MIQAYIVIGILAFLGSIGFLIINRGLTPELRKDNWIKYFTYLVIIFVVLRSIHCNKIVFAGLIIFIVAIGLIEMMNVSKKSAIDNYGDRILTISLGCFSIILLFFFMYVLLPEMIIAYTYTIVLIFDASSLISGQLAGKRKIVPAISPNKTWEGFIGGIGIAIIASVLLHKSAGVSVPFSVGFGFLVSLSSFAGDLLASKFKRIFSVKDFSNLLPGQGGMFDRFDSFLASGALTGLLGLPYLINNHPDKDIAIYLAITFMFFVVVIIGELLHKFLRLKPEYSRMLSHFFGGIISLIFIQMFSSPWYVIALCLQSAIFLFATQEFGFLDSVNKVGRKTTGTSIFFLGIMITYLLSYWADQKSYFVIAILIMTISDPLAALVGINFKYWHWTNFLTREKSTKTFAGSFAFFLSAFLLLLFILPLFYDFNLMSRIIISVLISLFAAFIEAISKKGYDNLFVPCSIIGLLMVVDILII
jgi:phosphatidate cytidylyltransferase